jgi:hypothetical protein
MSSSNNNHRSEAIPNEPLAASGVSPLALAAPAPFRTALMSFLAAGVGLLAGIVAYILYKLIGLFTNLFFFHEATTTFRSVGDITRLVGSCSGRRIDRRVMACTVPKIKGHGILRRWRPCSSIAAGSAEK